jgi:RNA polymerase sigma-70 factor (ECF subfamily)
MTRERFHSLALSLRPSLKGTAWRLCRNAADAEDLVQETYARALRYRHKFHGGRDPVRQSKRMRAWLLKVMHRRFLSGWQRACRDRDTIQAMRHHVPRVTMPVVRLGTIDDFDEGLVAAIEGLSSPHRLSLILHAGGMTYAEIAGQMGCDPMTAGSRISRARAKAKSLIQAGTLSPAAGQGTQGVN